MARAGLPVGNLYPGLGVAVRELVTGAGPPDYVLFVNRQAVGVIEAKRGPRSRGVEPQTLKYQATVPDALPAYQVEGLLRFGYESTSIETWLTCRMDPEPTARRVFWFHTPETLQRQVEEHINHGGGSLRSRIPDMPNLDPDPQWLWAAQAEAIRNLETSLKANRSRALI